MTYRKEYLVLRKKGSLQKEGLEQYIRIVKLPETEEYSEKLSIEVGKVVNGTFSKPVSYRAEDVGDVMAIIKALVRYVKEKGVDRSKLLSLIVSEYGFVR